MSGERIGETSALQRSVIDYDKFSLPVCAFGASAAHVAALALVLPVLITLPAPGESMTARMVTIDVEVLAEAPATPTGDPIRALMAGTGVIHEAAPDAGDITGALPDPAPTETPEEAEMSDGGSGLEAKGQDGVLSVAAVTSALAPVAAATSAVAYIGPGESLSAVPIPLRKPDVTVEAAQEEKAKAALRKHVSARKPRARSPAKSQPVFRGLLGGRPATTMPEYRPPGQ